MMQIEVISARIVTLEDELRELTALATKTTATLGDEKVQSSGGASRVEEWAIKIMEKKEMISLNVKMLVDKRGEILEMIDENCSGDCIKLLYKRYLQGKRWEEIALEMGYTYQYVSGKLHRKALSQLQEGLDMQKSI